MDIECRRAARLRARRRDLAEARLDEGAPKQQERTGGEAEKSGDNLDSSQGMSRGRAVVKLAVNKVFRSSDEVTCATVGGTS